MTSSSPKDLSTPVGLNSYFAIPSPLIWELGVLKVEAMRSRSGALPYDFLILILNVCMVICGLESEANLKNTKILWIWCIPNCIQNGADHMLRVPAILRKYQPCRFGNRPVVFDDQDLHLRPLCAGELLAKPRTVFTK
jgi:hypothetical protein